LLEPRRCSTVHDAFAGPGWDPKKKGIMVEICFKWDIRGYIWIYMCEETEIIPVIKFLVNLGNNQ
jgi:hypothetical protein